MTFSSSAGLPDASIPEVFSFLLFSFVLTLPFVWSVDWPDLDFFFQDLAMSYSSSCKPRVVGAM